MSADLLRQTMRMAIATFLTAAIAERSHSVAYGCYRLLAIVVVVDDNTD